MRGRAASFKASHARSMSGRQARARPAMMGRWMTAAIELVGQTQLFLMVHAAAGRLLPVPQGGVENRDAELFRGHWSLPLNPESEKCPRLYTRLCYGESRLKQYL